MSLADRPREFFAARARYLEAARRFELQAMTEEQHRAAVLELAATLDLVTGEWPPRDEQSLLARQRLLRRFWPRSNSE